MGRQPAAEIYEFEIDPAMGADAEYSGGMRDGAAPGLGSVCCEPT